MSANGSDDFLTPEELEEREQERQQQEGGRSRETPPETADGGAEAVSPAAGPGGFGGGTQDEFLTPGELERQQGGRTRTTDSPTAADTPPTAADTPPTGEAPTAGPPSRPGGPTAGPGGTGPTDMDMLEFPTPEQARAAPRRTADRQPADRDRPSTFTEDIERDIRERDDRTADRAREADLEVVRRRVDERGRLEFREQAQGVEATAIRDLSEDLGVDLSGDDVDVDLVRTDDGERRLRARLTESGRRRVGAAQLDEELGGFVVTPGDVEVTAEGVRLSQRAQKDFSEFFQRQAEQLQQRLPDIQRLRRERRRKRFEEFRGSLEDLGGRLPTFAEQRRAQLREQFREARQQQREVLAAGENLRRDLAGTAAAPQGVPDRVRKRLAADVDEQIEAATIKPEDIRVEPTAAGRFRFTGLTPAARERVQAGRNVRFLEEVGQTEVLLPNLAGAGGRATLGPLVEGPTVEETVDVTAQTVAPAGDIPVAIPQPSGPIQFLGARPTTEFEVTRLGDVAPTGDFEDLVGGVRAGTGTDVTADLNIPFEEPAREAGRDIIGAGEDFADVFGRGAEAAGADLASVVGVEQPGAVGDLQEREGSALLGEVREIRQEAEGATVGDFAERDVIAGPETARGRFVSGAGEVGFQFVGSLPELAFGGAEFGAGALRAAERGEFDEFVLGTAAAGTQRARGAVRSARERPFETAGGLAFSVPLSAGAIGGATRLLGPRAGRAVAVGIQPGEELAISAARLGLPTRAATAVPGVRRGQIEARETADAEVTADAAAADAAAIEATRELPSFAAAGRVRRRLAETVGTAREFGVRLEPEELPSGGIPEISIPGTTAAARVRRAPRAGTFEIDPEIKGRMRERARELTSRDPAVEPTVEEEDIGVFRGLFGSGTLGETELPETPDVRDVDADVAGPAREPPPGGEATRADVAAEEAQGLLLRQEQQAERAVTEPAETRVSIREEPTIVPSDESQVVEEVRIADDTLPGAAEIQLELEAEQELPESDERVAARADARTEIEPRLETRPFEIAVEDEPQRQDVRLETETPRETRRELRFEAVAELESRAESEIDPTQIQIEEPRDVPDVEEVKDIFEFDVTTPQEALEATIAPGEGIDIDDLPGLGFDDLGPRNTGATSPVDRAAGPTPRPDGDAGLFGLDAGLSGGVDGEAGPTPTDGSGSMGLDDGLGGGDRRPTDDGLDLDLEDID